MLIGDTRVSKADGSQSLDLQRDALQAAGGDAGVDKTKVIEVVELAELEERLRRHLKPTHTSWRVDETYVRVKGRWGYPLPSPRFQRRHDRLCALGVARCRGGHPPVPQGAD